MPISPTSSWCPWILVCTRSCRDCYFFFIFDVFEILNKNAKIKEQFNYDGPTNLHHRTFDFIGVLASNMDVWFEMKVENMDRCIVDDDHTVVWIFGWLKFSIRKSADKSNYFIHYKQWKGKRCKNFILESNPMRFSTKWKKEFLEILIKTQRLQEIL